MKIALNRWCFPSEMSLAEVAKAGAKAGADALELNLEQERSAAPAGWRPEDEGKTLRDAGLEVAGICTGIGWTYGFTSPDAKVRAQALDAHKWAVEVAARMGTKVVLSVPGVVNEKTSYDTAYREALEGYRGLGDFAEQHGITIGAENVWNRFLLSPLEFARFVDEVNHAAVRAYFDVGNVLLYGYPEQWIRILGPRIVQVHVKDFRRSVGTGGGFVPLLEGDVDWPAVTQALNEVGYDGYLVAELSAGSPSAGTHAAETAVHALRRILGRR